MNELVEILLAGERDVFKKFSPFLQFYLGTYLQLNYSIDEANELQATKIFGQLGNYEIVAVDRNSLFFSRVRTALKKQQEQICGIPMMIAVDKSDQSQFHPAEWDGNLLTISAKYDFFLLKMLFDWRIDAVLNNIRAKA